MGTPVGHGVTVVVSDASLHGLGGVVLDLDDSDAISDLQWYAAQYTEFPQVIARLQSLFSISSADICPLELLAAGVGVSHALKRSPSSITVLCDNTPTVHAINNNRAGSHRLRQLLHYFSTAWPVGGYVLRAHHISSDRNSLADFLSRTSHRDLGADMSPLGDDN